MTRVVSLLASLFTLPVTHNNDIFYSGAIGKCSSPCAFFIFKKFPFFFFIWIINYRCEIELNHIVNIPGMKKIHRHLKCIICLYSKLLKHLSNGIYFKEEKKPFFSLTQQHFHIFCHEILNRWIVFFFAFRLNDCRFNSTNFFFLQCVIEIHRMHAVICVLFSI